MDDWHLAVLTTVCCVWISHFLPWLFACHWFAWRMDWRHETWLVCLCVSGTVLINQQSVPHRLMHSWNLWVTLEIAVVGLGLTHLIYRGGKLCEGNATKFLFVVSVWGCSVPAALNTCCLKGMTLVSYLIVWCTGTRCSRQTVMSMKYPKRKSLILITVLIFWNPLHKH